MDEKSKRAAAIAFVKALASGDFEQIGVLLHPEVTPPERFAGLGENGVDTMVNGLRRVHAAFGDFGITVDDTLVEGNTVVVRQTVDATHTGDLYGLPATNRHFTIDEVMFFYFRDGLIYETWNVSDRLGMMQQLGMSDSTPRWAARTTQE